MTEKQILRLRPEFNFGGMTMVEWFEVVKGDFFYSIRSGLNHADGETKSPYYYSETIVSKMAKKESLTKFTKWYESNTKI